MVDEIMLGKNIQFYREAAGLTQEELSHQLGVGSRTTVASWESAKAAPTADMLPSIADFFHISLDELFFGTYRLSNVLVGEKNDPTFSDAVMEYLQIAGDIDMEAANKCREAIFESVIRKEEEKRKGLPKKEYDPISFPLFLGSWHPKCLEMRERMKALRKLKRKNAYTYLDIMKAMNGIDREYSHHICLAYYFMLFTGDKVPSEQLYDRLYEVVSTPRKKND